MKETTGREMTFKDFKDAINEADCPDDFVVKISAPDYFLGRDLYFDVWNFSDPPHGFQQLILYLEDDETGPENPSTSMPSYQEGGIFVIYGEEKDPMIEPRDEAAQIRLEELMKQENNDEDA